MSIDATTRITRTDAGNAEISKPANGLSIGQRRMLAALSAPALAGDLMNTLQVDAPRLERDLAKLQELRLIDAEGASRSAARVPQAIAPAVVLGSPRQGSTMRWAVTLALLVGVGAVYLAYRPAPADRVALIAAAPSTASMAPATGATSAPAPGGAAAAAAVNAPAVNVLPVSATMLGDGPRERKPEAKAEPRPAPFVADSRMSEPKIPMVQSMPRAPAAMTDAAPAAAAAAAPTIAAAPMPAPVVVEAPVAIVPPPAAAAAPVQLALATPPAAETRATARPAIQDLKVLSREQPVFPREAVSAGISKGVVKAHLSVDATGKVATVSIVEASPRRVFDRAAMSALYGWTFNAGTAGRSIDVDIVFDKGATN